jgi:hypothetical protein
MDFCGADLLLTRVVEVATWISAPSGADSAAMISDVVVVHRLIGKGSKSRRFDAVCQTRFVSRVALVEFIDRGNPFLDRAPIRQKETIPLRAWRIVFVTVEFNCCHEHMPLGGKSTPIGLGKLFTIALSKKATDQVVW